MHAVYEIGLFQSRRTRKNGGRMPVDPFSALFSPFFLHDFPKKHLEITQEMIDIRANIDYT
jgi:hypothetical protein